MVDLFVNKPKVKEKIKKVSSLEATEKQSLFDAPNIICIRNDSEVIVKTFEMDCLLIKIHHNT